MSRGQNSGGLVWVTGAGGLLGSTLLASAAQQGITLRGLTRAELDLTDFSAVRALYDHERPKAIIHCAALSKSPACQANPSLARGLNVEVTLRLSEIAADAFFVFLSTDLIFDGQQGNYTEEASPNPLSVYGETKVLAEEAVRRHPRHLVVRTSLNAGHSPTGDRAFNEEFFAALKRGQTFRLFTDEYRCPIPAVATARALLELVQKEMTGTLHLAGLEKLSRWEIGQAILNQAPQFRSQTSSASLRDYAGAPRSPDTSLDCSRAEGLLSFPLPKFTEWLRKNRLFRA